MAKRKPKPLAGRGSEQRLRPEPPHTPPSLLRKILAKTWKGIVSVGVLVTLTGLFSLLPKVSVSAAQLLDPQAPFSAPFIISNDGYLSIHDITFRCVVKYVEHKDGGRVIVSPHGITSGQVIATIDPGEKSTVACPFPFFSQSPIIGADVEFVLKYRPDFVFWHREKRSRFGLAKDKDGQFHWFPRSTSE